MIAHLDKIVYFSQLFLRLSNIPIINTLLVCVLSDIGTSNSAESTEGNAKLHYQGQNILTWSGIEFKIFGLMRITILSSRSHVQLNLLRIDH